MTARLRRARERRSVARRSRVHRDRASARNERAFAFVYAFIAVVAIVAFVAFVAVTSTRNRTEKARATRSVDVDALERALASVADGRFAETTKFFARDVARERISTKPPAILLAGTSALAVRRAREDVERATSEEECVVVVDCGARALNAMATDEGRGWIQRELSVFFRRCSTRAALVVLHDVGKMSPKLIPALLPALSEDGAYEYDGESISTTHGVFLLTAELPHARGEDEKTFTRSAKGELVKALYAEDDEDATALAFRRRIDVAVPLAVD